MLVVFFLFFCPFICIVCAVPITYTLTATAKLLYASFHIRRFFGANYVLHDWCFKLTIHAKISLLFKIQIEMEQIPPCTSKSLDGGISLVAYCISTAAVYPNSDSYLLGCTQCLANSYPSGIFNKSKFKKSPFVEPDDGNKTSHSLNFVQLSRNHL